jgi:hypothetical protein
MEFSKEKLQLQRAGEHIERDAEPGERLIASWHATVKTPLEHNVVVSLSSLAIYKVAWMVVPRGSVQQSTHAAAQRSTR